MSTATFDPAAYKRTTREQWQTAAEPWYRWGPTLEDWLAEATELMLDMARLGPGAACSTSPQAPAARRSRPRDGPAGGCSAGHRHLREHPRLRRRSARSTRASRNVATRVMDGEALEVAARLV